MNVKERVMKKIDRETRKVGFEFGDIPRQWIARAIDLAVEETIIEVEKLIKKYRGYKC